MTPETERVDPEARARELLADGVDAISEAVEWSGLSRAQLYREMQAGNLAYLKYGKRRLIPRRALVELLAQALQHP